MLNQASSTIETGVQTAAAKSKLKLYVYGSCECDQYYHPQSQSDSKRPICLTDLPSFSHKADDEETTPAVIYPNPFLTKTIFKIACGTIHTIVLTTCGQAYSFGCNDEGALGRNGPENIPLKIPIEDPVDLVSAGDNHTLLANSKNGIVYFSGAYKFLRGDTLMKAIRTPYKFHVGELDPRVKALPIAKLQSGANHSCILVGGRIYCRGEPQSFTTGRRINERRKMESCLSFDGVGLTHVEDLWCGGYHTVVKVLKKGELTYYAWGLNTRGQLGINHFDSKPYPVQIKKLRGKDIVQVSAGAFFTIFLSSDGEVFGTGQNQDGQIGLGEDFQYQNSEPELYSDELEVGLVKKMKIEDSEQKPTAEGEAPPMSEADEDVPAQPSSSDNLYIKTIKKIPVPNKVSNIASGETFSFAWNNEQLYSWGFGSGYVLLNGEDQAELEPFAVKPKILNNEVVYAMDAGSSHVVYLAALSADAKPVLDASVTAQIVKGSKGLKRIKK